jgi:hypothetical protein
VLLRQRDPLVTVLRRSKERSMTAFVRDITGIVIEDRKALEIAPALRLI